MLAGTKTGKILLIDIASAEIIEEIDAHEGEIWQVKNSKKYEGGREPQQLWL